MQPTAPIITTEPAAAITPAPEPAINDDYWFKYSREIVSSSLAACDAAAAKLQSYAIWLWTIYTAGAGIGFTLAAKDMPLGAKILIAIPSGLLICVYWSTVWVQMPVLTKFDPVSPTQIERSYAHALIEKRKRLNRTSFLGAAAGLSVVVCLGFATTNPPKQPNAKFGPSNIGSITNEQQRIVLSGNFGDSKSVNVLLTWIDSGKTSEQPVTGLTPLDG